MTIDDESSAPGAMEEVLRVLSASVAHSVGNSIQGIVSLSELLESEHTPAARRHHFAGEMRAAGQEALELMRALARTTRNRGAAREVDLGQLVADALLLFDQPLRSKGFRTQFHRVSGLVFHGDPGPLHDALCLLLYAVSEAARPDDDAAVSIDVQLEREDQEADGRKVARLRVSCPSGRPGWRAAASRRALIESRVVRCGGKLREGTALLELRVPLA